MEVIGKRRFGRVRAYYLVKPLTPNFGGIK